MDWKEIQNLQAIPSPGLLVDADRVAANIAAIVQIVGKDQVSRLRPHVKTHKMPAVVKLQLQAGITKFKAATLAEANMIAQAGGKDVLIAYQMVGPNVARLATLIKRHPQTSFATIVDDISVVQSLSSEIGDQHRPLKLFIDVDCGMHRTGIPLGESLDRLRSTIESLSGIQYAGLHIYDGHSHSPDLDQRKAEADRLITTVSRYQRANPSPTIVGGGSPTFAIWADATDWECSPGTSIFWDRGYNHKFAELPFSIAVALLSRVISKPGANRLCFDLGYKAIAAEVPLAERLSIPALPGAVLTAHSEEHLVVESAQSKSIRVGEAFLVFPRHVCPTVALYESATVVRSGKATDENWKVTARDRSAL